MKLFKNMSIKAKLTLSSIASAVFVVTVGIIAIKADIDRSTMRAKMKRWEDIKSTLVAARIAHFEWELQAANFQYDAAVTTIDVEKDHHRCALGSWYYGDERATLQEELPALAKYFNAIEKPHEIVHSSVKQLEHLLSQGREGREKAIEAFRSVTLTALDEVQSNLSHIDDVINAKLVALEEQSVRAGKQSRMLIIVGMIGFTALSIITGVLIAKSITRPITAVVAMLKDIAQGEGDLTRRLAAEGKDELAQMATWFNSFVDKIRQIIVRMADNTGSLASASEELSAVSAQLLSSAEEMTSQSNTVAGATEQMSTNINTMASSAEEMSVNATTVASAAEQMSQNMNAVSGAVEEMSVSISDVTSNAKEAEDVSVQANTMAKSAGETMDNLGDAAKEIGKVTEVIKRIAEQTNLLALNATIEAASAGEAGKGFAVVANEIKELANQSAQAAGDIASRIEGVQGNSLAAVKVIGEIAEIIGKVNGSIRVISHSVEQQNKASNDISANVVQASAGAKSIAGSIAEVAKGATDMSRNSGEAARGAQDVASNIAGVSQASTDSRKGAEQVSTSARELASMSAALKEIVDGFKV